MRGGLRIAVDNTRRRQDRAPATHGPSAPPVAVVGRNCWRIAPASRVTFLVDAAAYFAAFAAAAERAERSILITSWDIDTRTRLWAEGDPAPVTDPTLPPALGDFLNTLVARKRDLEVYVLDWDFAMIYALEREVFPIYKFDWRTHRRLHFRLDAGHPLGASHHQKIVVIDDAVAFTGGLDICTRRWDTSEHRVADPRRVDASGRPYAPFHDVQIAVDGDVAAALGWLARERWWRATGQRLRAGSSRARPPHTSDPWPPALVPDLRDVSVAIARTEPAFAERVEIREVEALFLDAIAAARRVIYIENQYLTSARIGDALAARLKEPRGPEIAIVLPSECSGWLEERTMGVLRARVLARLRAADRFDRLHVYHPVAPDDPEVRINVHAKVMIVDDAFVRIGSANLSNRSMGLDTECDLAIDAEGRRDIQKGICGLRDRLVGEHLDVPREKVEEAIAATGSLAGAVETLRGPARRLEPLECPVVPEWIDALVPDGIDPERAMDPDQLIEEFVSPEAREPIHPSFLWGGATLLALAAVIALGTWYATSEAGAVFSGWLVQQRAAWAVAAFVALGLVGAPIVFPTIVAVLVFGAVRGAGYALMVILVNAVAGYVLGRVLGRDLVRRIAATHVNRLSRRLSRHGMRVVAGARLMAVAPFTMTGLVAGASRVPVRDYVLGTMLGVLPGTVAAALGTRAAVALVAHPFLAGAASLAVIGALLSSAGMWLARRRRQRALAGRI